MVSFDKRVFLRAAHQITSEFELFEPVINKKKISKKEIHDV